jgi:hypothetical protein
MSTLSCKRCSIPSLAAKLREERPGWTPPQNTDEWMAFYEAKWAAERSK